jgi:hypothetical protein
MSEITLLREAGPEGPALTPAVRSAARAALLDEIAGSRPVRRRSTVRPPHRRTALRIGAAVVGIAAAWTTAALVVGPDGAPPGDTAPPSSGAGEEDGVALVDFDMPAAPLALPLPPEGMSGPAFGAAGDGASMSYTGVGDPADRLLVHVAREPVSLTEGASEGSFLEEATTVQELPAQVVVMNPDHDDARTVYLAWERTPGQWVLLVGSGRFADTDVLAGLGAQLVESPQAIPVQMHLAPAGYSFDFLKVGGRVIRLADDSDPAMTRGLTVAVPLPEDVVPADRLLELVPGAVGPVEEVTVQGQPAQLLHVLGGDPQDWYLQARFPDGATFTVQAPGDLTREQLVQIADQVSHTP